MLDAALEQLRRWHDEGFEISLAVNLSARLLHDPSLANLVATALEVHRLPPGRLSLEITESAMMPDPEGALRTISSLTEVGVAFAIDDFGTGYSSLSYLKRLPARELKIDKSFVQHMDTDMRDGSIVRSAIELAHSLGAEVVAEGVETGRVCELLSELRCDYAQGYHLGRPMPGDAFERWMLEHRYEPPTATPGSAT